MSSAIDIFAEDLAALSQRVNGDAWAGPLRQRARQAIRTAALPTRKLEAWRYAHPERLAEGGYRTAFQKPAAFDAAALGTLGLGPVPAVPVALVDGAFTPVPGGAAMPRGVLACSLARAATEHPQHVEPHLGRGTEQLDDETFVTANTALLSDGAFVYVPPRTRLEVPLHLLLATTAGAGSMTHPRVLVVVGEGAELTLLESCVSAPGAGGYLTNAVTEIALGRGAQVRHVRVQTEAADAQHLLALAVTQQPDSRYALHTLSLGGQLDRAVVRVELHQGAEVDLDGLGVATEREHVDLVSLIDHAHPHTYSRERVKNVLAGDATSSFYGRVLVRGGARRSNAQQHNHNLLLSPRAVANTRPQLEIYNDDIQAAHGATVGQLDADQLFYLRARGISLEDARRHLTLAFARDLVDGLPEGPVRDRVDLLIREHVARATGGA